MTNTSQVGDMREKERKVANTYSHFVCTCRFAYFSLGECGQSRHCEISTLLKSMLDGVCAGARPDAVYPTKVLALCEIT